MLFTTSTTSCCRTTKGITNKPVAINYSPSSCPCFQVGREKPDMERKLYEPCRVFHPRWKF